LGKKAKKPRSIKTENHWAKETWAIEANTISEKMEAGDFQVKAFA